MRLHSASEMGSGEPNKSLLCPLCAPQALPPACAMCPKAGKKGNLNHCAYTRKKSWLLTSLGLLPSELVRHRGTMDPDSQVCCKKPGRREKQTQLQRKKSAFTGVTSFTLAASVSMWKKTPLWKKGFIVCYFIRNSNKFSGKKEGTKKPT